MEGNETNGLLGKAMHVGERLVEVRGEAARLKTAASHARCKKHGNMPFCHLLSYM